MQTKQDKTHHLNPTKKTSESTQKETSSAAASTRLPAWTNAWQDHLPTGLVAPLADLQAKPIVSQPGDPSEQEADQVATQVMGMAASSLSILAPPPGQPPLADTMLHLSPVPAMVQRAALEEETASNATATKNAPTSDAATAESVPETAPPDQTATPSLIVDDSVDQLAPGQMKKSDFLAQLRDAVCTTTEQALAGTIWSAAGCPWVDHWFGYYSTRDSQQIERAIRRYAPDTTRVTSASDYIPIICERVRHAISVWSTTGEITGVPEGMDVPGAGLMGVASSVVSGIASVGSSIAEGAESIASGIASAATSIVSGVGSALSSIGSLFFKGREGGAREASNPQAIQGQLGGGRSLDGGVRSHMESAFGADFSHVRVHTDATSAGLSESLNARAFTVGQDVAFGPGEYQPGTLVGDALIAHELAHVVQQGGGSDSGPMQKVGTEYNALEEDADVSAVGAVVSLWSGAKGGLVNVAQNTVPAMRSGLGLQRCSGRRTTPVEPKEADRLIRGRFGTNLAAAIAAGTHVSGIVHVVEEAAFRVAYAHAFGSIDVGYPDTVAFSDFSTTPPTVWIHRVRQHPATVVHEGLHVYSNPAMGKTLGTNIDEGTTEYFTRQIVAEQDILKRTGHYDEKFQEVQALGAVSGEDALRRAYFQGDIAGLRTAVDNARTTGTFNNWATAMQAGNWANARTAIQPLPVPSPAPPAHVGP